LFGLVILLLSLPGAVTTHARLVAWTPARAVPWLDALFLYGMVAAAAHLVALVTPRLRRAPFRIGVSIPGMTFIAAGALSGLWLLALLPVRTLFWALGWQTALDLLRGLDALPLLVAIVSIVTSARPRREVVRVPMARSGPPQVTRMPVERFRRRAPRPLSERPLRIVQITDTHIGPWQPIHRLHRQIQELLAHQPDLILLTGDFLTMEGSGTRGALAQALAPLRAVSERCVAIFGNHDHESPEEVAHALAHNRIRLLIDAEHVLATPVGPVQLVGADYVGKGREEHLHTLLARFPRRPDHLRLLLLHDPRGFRHVPLGDVDLTLSGHTHGGQLGLLSFGLDWTVLKRTPWPDHGLFGHGANRLYVHRGSGFYGFPLRVGVPGEVSMLEVTRGV
jgi:predicted MPP superfamily phosphohydrolase